MPDEERVESDSPTEEEQTATGEGGATVAGALIRLGGGEPFDPDDMVKTPDVSGPPPLPYVNMMEGEEASSAEERREKPREEAREAKDSKTADNTDSGAFLANSSDIVVDADITDRGRQRLSKEDGVWEEADDDADWDDAPEMEADIDMDVEEDEDEEEHA